MRKFVIMMLLVLGCVKVDLYASEDTKVHSTRSERNCIRSGNRLYEKSKYKEAAIEYQKALKENPMSAVGAYNLGLTNIRLASSPNVKEEDKKKYEEEGKKLLQGVIQLGGAKPELASRSAYNLGNVAFNSEDYQSALQLYKQALRLNPADNEARRNLRITQLKLKNNKDKNKDNKDKNKDNKDKQEKQDKQQNKDNQQDNKDKKEEQPKPQQPTRDNEISEQTADQILKAMENKEAQTRARVMNPPKSPNTRQSRRNW